ncbi:MAG: SIS domain-containing protein [Nitrospiraceae bacterium]|nr:MAG: SIS domain-containing protein [Nitrospiraceae bacterium]
MEENFSINYLDQLKSLLDSFPHGRFTEIREAMLSAYHSEKQVFIMGNGGSGSTASHFACDINKGSCFNLDKKFKVICLNDNIPTMLAYANDLSYSKVFVEQLRNFLQPGDVVIGISGSGNSDNVLQAISFARKMKAKTIGLSGFNGGKLSQAVDIPFIVAINDMQKVEDVHMIVVHMLMQCLCEALQSD